MVILIQKNIGTRVSSKLIHISTALIACSLLITGMANATPDVPIKLNQQLDSLEFVESSASITPDEKYAIYKVVDVNVFGKADLYSAPLDGSSPAFMISDGNTRIDDFIISADSKWVVYNSDHEVQGVYELYRAAADGSSSATKINITLGNILGIEQFLITSDSEHVVYAQFTSSGDTFLYSKVLNDLSINVTLLSDNPSHSVNLELLYKQNSEEQTSFSIDSDYVVYTSNADDENANELFSVPVDGSENPTKLSGNFPFIATSVSNYKVSPNGDFVIYTADHQVPGKYEVYGNHIEGGLHRKLNNTIGSAADIHDFSISPDNRHVVFSLLNNANQNRNKLFSINVTNTDSPVLIADAPNNLRDISNFTISPNSDQVIVTADFETLNQVELYKASIDVADQEKKNNDLLPANVDIQDYAISPNGNRIVIQAGSAQNPPSLFSVDSTGLEEIVVLTTQSLSGFSTLSDFNISPNSEFVIYLSEQETVNQEELLW